MKFEAWAKKWNIPVAALAELKFMFGITENLSFTEQPSGSEAANINLIKIEASQYGIRLWRNNVGATYTVNNNFIRYGLANESDAMNKVIKSSDLIGIKPLQIKPNMVGLTIGQFVAREVKKTNWRYTGNAREIAQLNWIQLINSLGGDACFATGKNTFQS